jgi:hypothetical protein
MLVALAFAFRDLANWSLSSPCHEELIFPIPIAAAWEASVRVTVEILAFALDVDKDGFGA